MCVCADVMVGFLDEELTKDYVTTIRIIIRIKNQSSPISTGSHRLGRRYISNNPFYANVLFRGVLYAIGGIETDGAFDFVGDAVGIGGGEIDFVPDGDYFEIIFDGKVGVFSNND